MAKKGFVETKRFCKSCDDKDLWTKTPTAGDFFREFFAEFFDFADFCGILTVKHLAGATCWEQVAQFRGRF